MSIFKKTLSCAVLAALGTCALAGCGRQDTSNEATTSASPEAPAAITETISESTAVGFITDLIEHIVIVGKSFRHFPEKGDRLIFVLIRVTIT